MSLNLLRVLYFSGNVDIKKNEVKLYNMSQNLLQSPYIDNSTVENWFTSFLQSPEKKNANKTRKNYLLIS